MKTILTYHLGIELTQKCNLNCSHCFRGSSCNLNISREILEKIFDEVKYATILDLSGGEVFLGYEQLKMLLEIAKEKGTKFEYCSMITNGTIYDQRIYDLLDEYFGQNYQVSISYDDFHEKSIERVYSKNIEDSQKPDLHPRTLHDVNENIKRHMFSPNCLGYHRVSNRLIDNGRAISLDTPKKDFEAMGYYYHLMNEFVLFSGPMIFVGADGYISDINSDIQKRNEQSIGNILHDLLSTSIINGGISIECQNDKEFFDKMIKRENDFGTHQGDHLIFKNNKMAYTTYTPDEKYLEAMRRLPDDFENMMKAIEEKRLEEFLETWDPIYNGDLSQIEHKHHTRVKNIQQTKK